MAFYDTCAAIGCMTPQAPRGGWVGRVGDKLVMGCNDTWPGVPRTWELACDENQWKGRTFNCTTCEYIYFFPALLTSLFYKDSCKISREAAL